MARAGIIRALSQFVVISDWDQLSLRIGSVSLVCENNCNYSTGIYITEGDTGTGISGSSSAFISMAQHHTRKVDARYSTNNNVGRDQLECSNNNFYTLMQIESGSSSSKPPASLSFNDAPIDLLSTYFTGREKELDDLQNILDMAHGNMPARCTIHGMPGVGKTQLALRYAKLSESKYSLIFWISSSTVEKLNQGFAKVLNLVDHPERLHQEQSARLTAARRWLEESDADGSVNWLLIFDNVAREGVGFLREHLPRKNRRGSILFTTRTEDVAKVVVNAAGQRHQTFELRVPDLHDAAKLFLTDAEVDTSNDSPSVLSKAEELVQCVGCLPLAIVQAASFMKQSQRTFDDLLHLYQNEQKLQVGLNS